MARELASIDVSEAPDLLRLAEEVHQTGRARVLRRADEDLAVLSPVASPVKRRGRHIKREADRAAFLSSAGGWEGNVDVDSFLRGNDESRSRSSRPPIEL